MMLEMTQHSQSSFVTLTYDDDHVPEELKPKDLQDWLKRIRKDIEPLRVRFYGVGEYGTLSGRPHYHLALFGYPVCERLGTDLKRLRCCTWCSRLSDTWGKGAIHSGPLSGDSAQYICGYVTKKMTNKDDPRLEGKHPEFARMSRQPGIGVGFLENVTRELKYFNLEYTQSDVPVALRHGHKLLPLGRFLRGKLRESLGWEKTAPFSAQQEYALKMLDLQQAAKDSQTSVREVLTGRNYQKSRSMMFVDNLNKRKD